MLTAVTAVMAGLVITQHGLAELPLLAVLALIVASIGVFVGRRIRSTTEMLAQTRYSVSGEGILVSTAGRQITIPPSVLREISFVKSMSQRGLVHFELCTNRGTLSLPPIESPEAFAAELKAALPSVPFKTRRALFVSFK